MCGGSQAQAPRAIVSLGLIAVYSGETIALNHAMQWQSVLVAQKARDGVHVMNVTLPEYRELARSSVDVAYFRRRAASEHQMALRSDRPDIAAYYRVRAQEYQAIVDRFGAKPLAPASSPNATIRPLAKSVPQFINLSPYSEGRQDR